jgi:hypothetical protein
LQTRKEGAGDLGEMTIFAGKMPSIFSNPFIFFTNLSLPVVYSIDNRESFIRAAQILYRLYGDREQQKQQKEKTGLKQKAMDRACVPLVLVRVNSSRIVIADQQPRFNVSTL